MLNERSCLQNGNFAHFFVVKTSLFIIKTRHFIEFFFTFFCRLVHLGRIWLYVYIYTSPTNKPDMQFKKYITLLASALLLFACAKEEFDTPTSTPDSPVTVGFWVGRGDTRTETSNAGFEMDAPLGAETTRTQINNDGISTSWSKDDKIALWATNNANPNLLSAKPFHIYYRDSFLGENTEATPYNNYAMFTTTLESPMPEGEYTYYATYPTPKSTSGESASFTLASSQDGLMGNGAAIMVAEPATYHQLQKVLDVPGDQEIDDDHLSLVMKHKTHALRFYAKSTKWGFNDGEKIERIIVIMPQNIAGDVTFNYTNATAQMATSNAVNKIELNLVNPIGASASVSAIEHAVAAILPQNAFGSTDQMEIRVFTDKQAVQNFISLSGRGEMAAGHITPVAMDCSAPLSNYKIRFTIGTNNLGEDVNTITLTAPAGTLWSANGSSVLTIDAKNTINKVGYYDLAFDRFDGASVAAYNNLNGKTITATYDSDHATVSNSFTINTSDSTYTNVALTVPYLFYEDFNGFAANSDHWEEQWLFGSFPANSEKNGSWVQNSGWSGNIWSTDGKVMKMRSYVGSYGAAIVTNAWYSRIDSPTLPLKPSKRVTLQLSFDVVMSTQASNGTPECIYGYTTSTNAIAGGYTASTIDGSVHQKNTPEYSIGSGIDNGTYNSTFTISSTPSTVRLSWLVGITYKGQTVDTITNRYFNMDLDNIKVSIVPVETDDEEE